MSALPTEIIDEFIATFITAWSSRDPSPLARFFAVDAVYCNGPLDPVHGRDAIVANIGEFMQMGGEPAVDMVHVVASDSVVLTERIDYFTIDDRTVSLPIAGVFELRDGVITAWRDYFDLSHFTSQMGGDSDG
jgi:limonene-1,2-epoxide hydrolase